ncbi:MULTISPECIES: KpsF/GutQ family sugar-phosphate isomerase [Alteromonas]|jgi:arabinose-5-phosphate isomerase|uniref:KpsF/GutQ family sugar-phosphate isomerase n=1 Tax=Alteromonas TaxID=226 RepID=UPI001B3A26A1|nr:MULTISPECIES: KpsF/GutQ family sugar-phosphate isomerase [Alteromonas]MBQ4831526.1 KpsF/GutQ family sugar-phosphate isomerase [Alteromonas sp. MMG017]MDO6536040.1 KpsF/GutQ family sugar-phosphate isomerase [Alteromonas stellipolaris]MDO6627948.1 KpsF/GutQ family sugar-phosphate isomerase [Alteromonas stellipolaris]
MDLKERAKQVFKIESEAVANLSALLTNDFSDSVSAILNSKGRLIVCGMGKSGIIGNKISATLASTGTPSFSMHPGEAFHGDLGMVASEDIFLAISNSGETEEVLKLLPFLKDNKNLLISLTGNPRSTLALQSEYHLNIAVPQEACPLKLAPTASTTATLAMGDALAIALMEGRDFRPENFARFHPGGSLGRKLLHKVKDQMVSNNLPIINIDSPLIDIIDTISKGEQGLAIVTNDESAIIGLITDGDIRRAIEHHGDGVFKLKATDLMSRNPYTIGVNELVSYGDLIMEDKKLNKLLVEDNGRLVGILRK